MKIWGKRMFGESRCIMCTYTTAVFNTIHTHYHTNIVRIT